MDFESSAICAAFKTTTGHTELSCLLVIISWIVISLIFFELLKGLKDNKPLALMLGGLMSLITIRLVPSELIVIYQQLISLIFLFIGPILVSRFLAEPGRRRMFVAVLLYLLMGYLLFVPLN